MATGWFLGRTGKESERKGEERQSPIRCIGALKSSQSQSGASVGERSIAGTESRGPEAKEPCPESIRPETVAVEVDEVRKNLKGTA